MDWRAGLAFRQPICKPPSAGFSNGLKQTIRFSAKPNRSFDKQNQRNPMKGKIVQWHDEKGYGFIQIEDGNRKIFCHISDFAQRQPRPQEGEAVSFDIVSNEQGKFAAKRIRYIGRTAPDKSHARRRQNTHGRHGENRSSLGSLLASGLTLAFLGFIGYQIYQFAAAKFTPKQPNTPKAAPFSATSNASKYRCDGRTHCSQMTSCEEATWFLRNCAGTKMDGNGDGVPCEQQLCR